MFWNDLLGLAETNPKSTNSLQNKIPLNSRIDFITSTKTPLCSWTNGRFTVQVTHGKNSHHVNENKDKSVPSCMSDASLAWPPLECNPEVLTTFAHNIGVSSSVEFTDVFGFDDDILAFVPQPVFAVIVLFNASLQILPPPESTYTGVFFLKQLIQNACGPIAVIHATANNPNLLTVSSPLSNYLEDSKTLNFEERGLLLAKKDDIRNSVAEASTGGQTGPVNADDDLVLHFVCFIENSGHLIELDGRKHGPVNHGNIHHGLLKDATLVIQKWMADHPEEQQWSVLALTSSM